MRVTGRYMIGDNTGSPGSCHHPPLRTTSGQVALGTLPQVRLVPRWFPESALAMLPLARLQALISLAARTVASSDLSLKNLVRRAESIEDVSPCIRSCWHRKRHSWMTTTTVNRQVRIASASRAKIRHEPPRLRVTVPTLIPLFKPCFPSGSWPPS